MQQAFLKIPFEKINQSTFHYLNSNDFICNVSERDHLFKDFLVVNKSVTTLNILSINSVMASKSKNAQNRDIYTFGEEFYNELDEVAKAWEAR